MALHPSVRVSVDGTPVSGLFFERLMSLTITDREGIRSDSLDLVFSDGAPHLDPPRRGAVVAVSIDTGAGVGFAGSYIVDRVEMTCFPFTLSVRGHSADYRSDMKTNKTRHWDGASVRQIVEDIAADYGLTTKIADAVSDHVYDWIGQQDETDLAFLERLAERHGALFTIKAGKLLWLRRGAGETADGTGMTAVQILPGVILQGSCRVSIEDGDRFATVKAYWQDRSGARRQSVVVEADPEASGEHVLRSPFGTEAEARRAAEAAAREMVRGLVQMSCVIEGNPALMAGQPVVFAGVRSWIDGQEFILETVQHSFGKSGGLRTSLSGKLRAE
ncbi:late control protein D [Pseudooceanicola sp. CBS1P-1]|uniref:Late control protein D n=1 Tax=Pseudooceanicola albus TaxID=2692189 RepID=A0A6L7FYK3_9RHOB|nr:MULTISPECIES: contractile injection system protein, VgrG/Pvc8 family [Pseudooceanicola]MBT9383339.1 late control protein D [Pseudooceanicola endophyticus]MXN16338.1 late control protein D [Pseudooceanicola albus]